jgi:hypothetical protein
MISAGKLLLLLGGGALVAVAVTVAVMTPPKSGPAINGVLPAASPASGPHRPVAFTEPLLPKPVAVFPAGDGAYCGVAHGLAPKLLVEIEATIDPALRAAAEKYVAGRDRAASPAKAWDDLAMAMLLTGDAEAATWCGLHAIALQWTCQFTTNCGVYLFYCGRLQEALAMLECAYSNGCRSPYLLEALAALFRRLGKSEASKQYVVLAQELAPQDPVLNVERHQAETGELPPNTPPPASGDCLDEAMTELLAHARRVTASIDNLVANIARIEADRDSQQWLDRYVDLLHRRLELRVKAAKATYERAQMSLEEYQRTVGKGQPFNAEGHARYMRMMWNLALQSCIDNHLQLTRDLIDTFAGEDVENGPGLKLAFWGDVLYQDGVELAKEQKLVWDASDHRHEISSEEHCSLRGLDHTFWISYAQSCYAAGQEYKRDFDACNELHDAEALRACMVRAAEKQCTAVSAAYDRLVQQSTERFDLAAHHCQLVATAMLQWGQREVLQSRDYAQRHFACMRFAADEPRNIPMPDGTKTTESASQRRIVQGYYDDLLNHLRNPTCATWGLAKWLREQGEWFAQRRNDSEQRFALEKQSIEQGTGGGYGATRGCAKVRQAFLELLAQEAWQQYLTDMQEQMQGDFQVKYDATANCEGAIGPVTFSVDDTGKSSSSLKAKNFWQGLDLKGKASIKDAAFAGGSIGLGSSASDFFKDYPPFVGKAEGTVFTEINKQTGKMDAGFSLTAALGLGVKAKGVNLFGSKFDLGIACYPGSVSAKFQARAFYDHAVEYVAALIDGGK